MKRLRAYLVPAMMIALLGGSSLRAAPGGNKYAVVIGGFYSGTGILKVMGHKISITGTVTGGGQTGIISFPDLPLSGNYFSGTGTLLGHAVTISGRFDSPKGKDQGEVTAPLMRVAGTFKVDDGHHGRVAGADDE